MFCRTFLARSGSHLLLAMQKVEGSNPFSRFKKGLHLQDVFRCSSRVVRRRYRTMAGQSCPRRLADAVGRCSLAGDPERPAPWNFCVPAEDRDRPRRVGAPAPPAPLRLVRGRSAAFVEKQCSRPAVPLFVRRDSQRGRSRGARFRDRTTLGRAAPSRRPALRSSRRVRCRR